MDIPPWFEWVPDLLVQEERAFREEGLALRVDREALKRGVARFRGYVRIDGEKVLLEVHYPDGFPFVPPQVYAPELCLERHQNPYTRNLCVWPTGTQPWNPRASGAYLVKSAVRLISASRQGDEAVIAIEEHAPDFRGAFYPYTSQSSLLIPEEALDVPDKACGRIEVLGPSPAVPHRALLKRVLDTSGTRWQASAVGSLRTVFGGGGEVIGLWTKVADYPPFFEPAAFADHFFKWFYALDTVRDNLNKTLMGGGLGWFSHSVEFAAVSYPEEFAYRDYSRANWLAVLRYTDSAEKKTVIYRPQIVPMAASYFQRMPRLAPLSGKSVAIIGLGALGSHVAVELAKAGISKQYLIDGDILEPANLVRHACTIAEVGLPKANAVASRIRTASPVCEVVPVPMHLGNLTVEQPQDARAHSLSILEYLRNCNVVVDAAATDAVSYFINKVCARLDIPQVYVRGTNGGWGGELLRVVPGETACFECFMRSCWLDAGDPGRPIGPDEEPGMIPALGCADRTFTGSGFDMASVALLGVRMVVQTLVRDSSNAYPDADYDYLCWMNTGQDGAGFPEVRDRRRLTRSDRCSICMDAGS